MSRKAVAICFAQQRKTNDTFGNAANRAIVDIINGQIAHLRKGWLGPFRDPLNGGQRAQAKARVNAIGQPLDPTTNGALANGKRIPEDFYIPVLMPPGAAASGLGQNNTG